MVKTYNLVTENKEFESAVGSLLSIKKNGNNLNVYNFQGEIIETFNDELPEEIERSFQILPEKKVYVEKEADKYILRLVRFVDYHRHSGYSMLDGATHIDEMAAKTELFGAITDHGNMFGAVEFEKEMLKAGKKPIIGVEVYTESIDGSKDRNHLILLVKNLEGYRNLSKLLTVAEENRYYVAQVSYDMLEKYSEGLIATSACLSGEVSKNLKNNDYDQALEVVETYQGIFGKDYYLEIQKHGIEIEKQVNPALIKLSKETGVKLVGAIDSHYLNREDRIAQEALLGVGVGQKITDANRFIFDGDGYHVHTPKEFEELFADIPEAIYNLYEIAEKVNFKFKKDKHYMPHFPLPEGFTSEKEYFIHLTKEGFKNRFIGTDKLEDEEYLARLEDEIRIITDMGYEGYFLIVSDFIRYAKNNDIMVGPGRGSAAGSLVSYVLDIIDLDPIEHDLLFERFLNPDRVSMPDIDVDFEDTKRHLVLDYVKNKYGAYSTSGIITFGTFASRSVIRDIAKYFDFPQVKVDKLKDAVPKDLDITLEKAYNQSPELKKYVDEDKTVKLVFDIAKKLEGLPRHISQHACGYIIADGKVSDYVPDTLVKDNKTKEYNRVASYNMIELEELGLLKMDFLGLRNMTVIGESLRNMKKDGIDVNYYEIDYYNPYLYKFIGTGNTTGLFQIESPGMRSLMVDMFYDTANRIEEIENKYGCIGYIEIEASNPNADIDEFKVEMEILGREMFDRLVAAVSLYRPGPMDYIPQYLEGLRNPETIHYDTPELEPILKQTYGVIVYQEQVQRIARDLAGYSLARGDLLRRAMGKKDMSIMAKEKEIFINGLESEDQSVPGCLANGISEEAANTIWDKMVEFANYAFNKSHSAAYSVITAKTAFLRVYYPLYFYQASLNSVIDNQDKLKVYLADLKDNNFELLSPSILSSGLNFTIEDNGIRFGLKGLRNVGKNALPIIEERTHGGQFVDLQDFVYRMREVIQKRPLEALIYSGALDEFETGTRLDLLNSAEDIINYAADLRSFEKVDEVELDDVFELYKDLKSFEVKETGALMDKSDLLFNEYHYTGLFITEHPVDQYAREIEYIQAIRISDLIDESEYENNLGKKFKVVGIADFNKIFTKKNDLMFNGTIEDETSSLNMVIFPSAVKPGYETMDKDLEQTVVVLEGTFEENDFGKQLIVDTIMPVSEVLVEKEKAILIYAKKEDLDDLKNILDQKLGEVDVYVKVDGNTFKYNKQIELDLTQDLKIRERFGNFKRSF